MDFQPFPKIPRLNRQCVITEKLDGTNAQIVITDDGQFLTASRNRWITPTDDNYGFSYWANANKEELMKLGPGQHFGEWWGGKIGRGYGLKEKKFSLFNTFRWSDPAVRPACADIVPVLFEGPFHSGDVNLVLDNLRTHGSYAVPGWMKPEGVVVFHEASKQLFKVTCEKDESPKGV